MASLYPGALDALPDPATNLNGPPLHSAIHNAVNDAIEAVQAELGINPSGAYATVAAALAGLVGASIPPGALSDYAGATAPAGWLLCDGASVLRATYPDLFTAIGTTYGAVDSTHFTVPDLRGRVAVGLDNLGGTDAGRLAAANTLGGSGGAETVTLTTAEMPSHSHTYNRFANQVPSAVVAGTDGLAWFDTGNTATTTTGGGGAHQNMPPYILVLKIIKT